MLISFTFLFFVQNVFQQQVYQEVHFKLSAAGIKHLADAGISSNSLLKLKDRTITQPVHFRDALRELIELSSDQEQRVIETAERYPIIVTAEKIAALDREYLIPDQLKALESMAGLSFQYKWAFEQALTTRSTYWQKKPKNLLNKDFNDKLTKQFDYLFRKFHIKDDSENQD